MSAEWEAMILKRLSSILSLVVLIFSVSAAADSNRPLANGIYVNLSPKGQKTLSGDFKSILSQSGISLDEIVLPEYVYESPKALSVEDFPPQFHEPIQKLRKIFEEWLLGFEWSDPRPHLEAGPLRIAHRSLNIDFRVLPSQSLDELNVQLSVQLERMKLTVDRVRLKDLNNDFLGEMGMDDYTFTSAEDSVPLKFQVLVRAKVVRGALVWQLDSLRSNLSAIKLEARFKRPLILPEVELRIGSRTHKLNTQTLEEKLIAIHPTIIERAKVFASAYIEKDLVEKIQQMPRDPIDLSSLAEANTFAPPGAPATLPQGQFFNWKLVPDAIYSSGSNLRFGFAVSLWDPVNRNAPAIDPNAMASGLPASIPQDANVDLDLMLNQGFMNRVVQLSFARRYFERHELEPGEIIRFKTPPRLTVPRGIGARDMELSLDFEAPLAGLKKFFVGDAVHIKIPVRARFESGPKGFQLKMVRLEVERMWINPDTVNRLFLGMVKNGVEKKFNKLNEVWSKNPSVLIEALPVPDSALGLDLKVKDIRTDPSGYVHFLVDFEKSKIRSAP